MDLWDFQNNFQRNINPATIVERNVDSYLCKAIILKIKKKMISFSWNISIAL